jgi:hypothetical protein
MSPSRYIAVSALVASALCVGATGVGLVVLKPHWQAREPGWMLGGAALLFACVVAARACFRFANRHAPRPEHDVQARAQQLLGQFDEYKRSAHAAADSMEAHRDLMGPEAAQALDTLRATLHQWDVDSAQQARERSRRHRVTTVVAWTVGIVMALLLLEGPLPQ